MWQEQRNMNERLSNSICGQSPIDDFDQTMKIRLREITRHDVRTNLMAGTIIRKRIDMNIRCSPAELVEK